MNNKFMYLKAAALIAEIVCATTIAYTTISEYIVKRKLARPENANAGGDVDPAPVTNP